MFMSICFWICLLIVSALLFSLSLSFLFFYQGKRKALKLIFANPPVKPTSRLSINPTPPSFQNPHMWVSDDCTTSTHIHTIIHSLASLSLCRERLRTHSIESSGKLKISPEQHCDFTAEDLRDLGEIGRGAYGSVNKMVHKPTGQIMAVKVKQLLLHHHHHQNFIRC